MLKAIAKLQRLADFQRAPVQFDFTAYHSLLQEIDQYRLESESDARLREYVTELRTQVFNNIPLEKLLSKTYALVREVSRRILGLRPFDVQVLAGIAMHHGKIVEMLTGEGKTLAAVLPACLNGLAGQGVHILTFNDYLAKRDAHWMGPVYQFHGLTVGYIQSGMNPAERKKAYDCDITYVTAKEAGFDHLRSFLCYDKADLLQRPFHFAIIDEADSILIDEGRIPLIIAGNRPVQENKLRQTLAELVLKFIPEIDYGLDEYQRNVFLTESGIAKAEAGLNCDNLYNANNLKLLTLLNNALHAEVLLHRDIDYIIRDGRIELVDEFTGRVVENRHWPDGLQEAIVAKEGLDAQWGGRILGSITMQHFLNGYPKIAGMTGTAQAAADEFKEFYNLEVAVIPPNRPCIRIDEPDLIFTDQRTKLKAIIQEIIRVHAGGRPVLIGTGTIRESESLAGLLDRSGIPYQLLNAKNDEQEAQIIAQAGRLGAVTISTNMAGRGTDIRLGGAGATAEEYARVKALGGLYIIGTTHFESTRIDAQLRGRAGRQGDPGSSRFFISMEDELICRYGIRELLPSKYRHLKQENFIAEPALNRQLLSVQRIIAAQNYEIRKSLWKYSWIVEQQRRVIHERRRNVLLDHTEPWLFRTALPERYTRLSDIYGETVLQQAEKYVTLYHIDNLWADFLEEIAQVREGIHLVSLSGRNPLDEFHRLVTAACFDLQQQIDAQIIATLRGIEITDAGIDLEKEGLRGPSATWTYLVNDAPFGGTLAMMLAPLIKKLLKRSDELE